MKNRIFVILTILLIFVALFAMDRKAVRLVLADDNPCPYGPCLPTDIPVDTPDPRYPSPTPTFTMTPTVTPTPTITPTATLVPYTKAWCDMPGVTAHLWMSKPAPGACYCQVPDGTYIPCSEYDKIY